MNAPSSDAALADIELRDHFAGLAMQSLIDRPEEFSETEIANAAYRQADAMMVARVSTSGLKAGANLNP